MSNSLISVGIRMDGIVSTQWREGAGRTIALLNDRRLSADYREPADERPSCQ